MPKEQANRGSVIRPNSYVLEIKVEKSYLRSFCFHIDNGRVVHFPLDNLIMTLPRRHSHESKEHVSSFPKWELRQSIVLASANA